jgi:hypothetical protein
MDPINDKLPVTLVTACMTADGTPGFAITTVAVTEEEAANGRHYELAEVQLLQSGKEEPFVHFSDAERPEFLLPAVRDYLDLAEFESYEPQPLIVENADGAHHRSGCVTHR